MPIGKKILLVEDEKNIILGVKTCLEIAAFKVIVVEDGKKVLDTAVSEKPDLILLDLMLPGLHGNEVCQQLKAHAETKHIPVIVLTARTEQKDRDEAMAAGADSFMTKPFRPEELWQEIKRFL
ncbi:MAG: response regulator [Bacillota bacterium]